MRRPARKLGDRSPGTAIVASIRYMSRTDRRCMSVNRRQQCRQHVVPGDIYEVRKMREAYSRAILNSDS